MVAPSSAASKATFATSPYLDTQKSGPDGGVGRAAVGVDGAAGSAPGSLRPGGPGCAQKSARDPLAPLYSLAGCGIYIALGNGCLVETTRLWRNW